FLAFKRKRPLASIGGKGPRQAGYSESVLLVAAAGAAQAAHEGFFARLDHQGLRRLADIAAQRGERQADDEGCSADGSGADQQRAGDDQVTDHGIALGRFDGVERITAGVLLNHIRLRRKRQQASGQRQDNSGSAERFHGSILQVIRESASNYNSALVIVSVTDVNRHERRTPAFSAHTGERTPEWSSDRSFRRPWGGRSGRSPHAGSGNPARPARWAHQHPG